LLLADNSDLKELVASLDRVLARGENIEGLVLDTYHLCKAKDNGWKGYLECLEKNPGCGNAIRFADMYMCNSPVRIGIVRKYKL